MLDWYRIKNIVNNIRFAMLMAYNDVSETGYTGEIMTGPLTATIEMESGKLELIFDHSRTQGTTVSIYLSSIHGGRRCFCNLDKVEEYTLTLISFDHKTDKWVPTEELLGLS